MPGSSPRHVFFVFVFHRHLLLIYLSLTVDLGHSIIGGVWAYLKIISVICPPRPVVRKNLSPSGTERIQYMDRIWKKAGKALAAVTAALWMLFNIMCIPGYGNVIGETEISSVEQLKAWYESQGSTGDTGNTMGVLKENLVINSPVVLGQLEGLAEGAAVELRIPDKKSLRIASSGSLVIDNPALVIHGAHHFLTVEGKGKLGLKRGRIDAAVISEPAVIQKDYAVIEFGREWGARNFKIDTSQLAVQETAPSGDAAQGTGPRMTEALLTSLDAEGNGSARLEFENLPSDINALYIYRSRDGKSSWTKEKNRLSAASSQGGQDTVEYENFLKETGNTLNRSIVEDGYLTYRFQSAYESFYVKARIEWPGGEQETEKIKLPIPGYVSSGNEFSYSGGGQSGGFRGYYSNLGGQLTGGSYRSPQETEEESDAPEAPVRGGKGRSRGDSPVPYTAPAVPGKAGTEPGLATPSTPLPVHRAEAEAPIAGPESGEEGNKGDAGNGPEIWEQDIGGQDSSPVPDGEMDDAGLSDGGQQAESDLKNQDETGKRNKTTYIMAALASLLIMGGAAWRACRYLRGKKGHQR